jgi:CBS domain-containing protein
MRVRDVMTKEVEVVASDAFVREAAAKMRDRGVGFLPVMEHDRPIGAITDRDIAVRVVAASTPQPQVRQVMSSGVASVHDDEEIAEAGRKMREHSVRRLVVLDSSDHICGVVSLGDLATRGQDGSLTSETLASVCRP